MPLFRRKHKPSAAASAFRSVEHLPAAPGVYPDDDLDRRFSVSTSRERLPPLPVTSSSTNNTNTTTSPPSSTAVNTTNTIASTSTSTTPGASPQLYQHDNNTQEFSTHPLRRSKSQRHTSPRGNNSNDNTPVRPASPAPILDADPLTQSWPLPPEPLQPVEPEPRKSRRSLFSLHSSAAARDQSGILQRSRSVKKISTGRSSKQQRPLSIDTTSERRPGTSWSREHELDAPWPKVPQARRPQQPPQQQPQQQQQQPPASIQGQAPQPQPQSQTPTPSHTPAESPVQPPRNHPQAQQQPASRSPMPQNTGPTPTLDTRPPRSPHPSVQRSNTDSGLLEHLTRPSPVEPSRQPADLAPTPPQLDPTVGPRPSSRQSLGPPSPLRPLPVHPDTVASGMPDRPSAPPGQSPVPGHSPYPEAGFRNNTASTPEQGRNTPSSRESRRDREDAEIDVRALVQKHDELRK